MLLMHAFMHHIVVVMAAIEVPLFRELGPLNATFSVQTSSSRQSYRILLCGVAS